MHIPNFSVASLFSEMQSLFNGAIDGSSSLGTSPGQNMPFSPAGSGANSVAASPLPSTPGSQFASNLLSQLLQSQQSWSQTAAGDVINAINPGGTSIDLSQVEQALTGSTSTTSPQQQSIANAFSQLTGGTDQLTQSQLAQSLQEMNVSMNDMGWMGMHHHHHHLGGPLGASDGSSENGSSTTSSISTTPVAS